MASVSEIKNGLLERQDDAIEATATAISAIDTLLNMSMWVLAVLGIIIALIAFFGYVAIRGAAVDTAKKVEKRSIDDYIKGDDFLDQLDNAVRDEVKERVKDKIILAHLKEEVEGDEPDPFPSARKGKP